MAVQLSGPGTNLPRGELDGASHLPRRRTPRTFECHNVDASIWPSLTTLHPRLGDWQARDPRAPVGVGRRALRNGEAGQAAPLETPIHQSRLPGWLRLAIRHGSGTGPVTEQNLVHLAWRAAHFERIKTLSHLTLDILRQPQSMRSFHAFSYLCSSAT